MDHEAEACSAQGLVATLMKLWHAYGEKARPLARIVLHNGNGAALDDDAHPLQLVQQLAMQAQQ
jgi:hypothetical protein